ncbi:carbohydrate-binding protein [candidate division KSB1 bacterium]|nr:carbohydrate-binding protein [candidate division KSB1 bacterium]
MKILKLFWIFLFIMMPLISSTSETVWGRLANSGFENHPIKSTFFFAGNARNGIQYYDVFASSNEVLYTIHPSDSRHLSWSVNSANREYAIKAMIDAGVNVINMSYWGPPGTDNWAWWAPMQSSTESHDELFDAAVDKDILIAPYIESYTETPNSSGFIFRDDFPGSSANPAPGFVAMCKDLIDRYLVNPIDESWPDQWVRVYDQTGEERYLISIIHVSSNQANMSHEKFANGFDRVAQKILTDTGIPIGFAIDVMPPGTNAPGFFRPAPQTTGPWLATQNSLLGIQCFISEIWVGSSDETQLINWKQQFASDWIQTGIPFIIDISPGYDAHIVFPGSVQYGNNSSWREALTQWVFQSPAQGVTFNAWNGYTEGMAGVPTQEYGDANSEWLEDIFQNFTVGSYFPVPGKIEAESYSQMSGVDTETTTDVGGGLNIAWIDDGDWIEFEVAVLESGIYSAEFRTAKLTDDFQGLAYVNLDGQRLSRFLVPGTGGWQNWTTVLCPLNLQSGTHQFRLHAQVGGWNINWMDINLEDRVEIHEIPGKIEAEAFVDMSGVETEMLSAGVIHLGWFDDQDWIDYRVDVQETGQYDVTFRVSLDSGYPDGQGALHKDGEILCEFEIPPTGGWNQWESITCIVNLEAGEQILRVNVTQAPWNLDWMKFNRSNTSVPYACEKENNVMSFVLCQNYPNPFNPTTTITYQLLKMCDVTITIHNILAQKIITLIDKQQEPGKYHIVWNGKDGNGIKVASGLYFYKIKADNFIKTNKMILLQ